MSEIRYTIVEGTGRGREYPMTDSQYFARRGGKFVKLSAGAVSLVGSTDEIFGWCETAKDDTGKNAWMSVSGDTGFVYYADPENVFELPVNELSASLAASQIGLSFKCVTVGATYAMKQYALVSNTATAGLNVVDVDTTNKTVRVKVDPRHRQN